jgi:hypothetical protein
LILNVFPRALEIKELREGSSGIGCCMKEEIGIGLKEVVGKLVRSFMPDIHSPLSGHGIL